ncbi:nitroreductase/quinone reductase family protein [Saccharopolyspora spinosporotrichia]
MPNDFNLKIIEEFRARGGRVGGPFEGGRLLLLTTTGARTGARHTTPVGYLPDGDGRTLVIASAGGSPRHPDWFHNVVANPRVTVEDGVFTYEADAVVLEGPERDRVFARAVEFEPGWGEYQAGTTRVIPVVALEAVAGGPPLAGSLGETLRRTHDAFRRELELIRGEVAATGPRIGAQLRVNCLTLCQGLRNHHAGEDGALFPSSATAIPSRRRRWRGWTRSTAGLAALLAELQAVVSGEHADRERTSSEVDRLAEELKAHLAYEEEQLLPVLDAVTA